MHVVIFFFSISLYLKRLRVMTSIFGNFQKSIFLDDFTYLLQTGQNHKLSPSNTSSTK